MLKLPYWICMGASDQDPVVSSEINDWWEAMAADARNTTRLMGYPQLQMKMQSVYDGEINGQGNAALLRAVRVYELALGLPDDVRLERNFLRKHLAAVQIQVRKVAAAQALIRTRRAADLGHEVAQRKIGIMFFKVEGAA
jgi:hypothetical protein